MANLTPYINFRGTTQEAMEFYHSIFGGEYTRSTFADFGVLPPEHPHASATMHSQIVAGDVRLMAADYIEGFSPAVTFGNNVTMAIAGSEKEQLESWFLQLAEGGTIAQPLGSAPWGALYGALTDKFGTYWQFNIDIPQEG